MSTATMHIPTEDAELLRLPDSSGYTVDDLHALPDDGRRYELIDGSIIVSPSPTINHNRIARWIANELERSAPDGFVIGTDQSTSIDRFSEPRPDVVVAREEHADHSPFPIAGALLVVEVVSPTSVLNDREAKRVLYAKAGIPSYWIVEPNQTGAKVVLSELTLVSGGRYGYAAERVDGTFRTDAPWPVEIDLVALGERLVRRTRTNT
jgi:Uma2 family endonuclease